MRIVSSMAEMMEHLETQVPLNSREITNLQNKIDSLKAKDVKPTSQSATVEKQEELLPPGWTKKRVGESSVFVSPDGEQVPTIQQLLSMESQKSKRKAETSLKVDKKGQSESLEDHFQVCMFPDEKMLEELKGRYGKSVPELKKWFLKRANDESKKRLKTSASDPKQEKNNPSKPKGTKNKMAKRFNELTNEQNTALQKVLETSPCPPTENILSELSTKHHIDQKLLIKWFSLKKQQRAASQ